MKLPKKIIYLFFLFWTPFVVGQTNYVQTSQLAIQELSSPSGDAIGYFDTQIPALEDKLNLVANELQQLQDPTIATAVIKKEGKEVHSYAFSEAGEFKFKVDLIYNVDDYDDLIDWVEFSTSKKSLRKAPPPVSEEEGF